MNVTVCNVCGEKAVLNDWYCHSKRCTEKRDEENRELYARIKAECERPVPYGC